MKRCTRLASAAALGILVTSVLAAGATQLRIVYHSGETYKVERSISIRGNLDVTTPQGVQKLKMITRLDETFEEIVLVGGPDPERKVRRNYEQSQLKQQTVGQPEAETSKTPIDGQHVEILFPREGPPQVSTENGPASEEISAEVSMVRESLRFLLPEQPVDKGSKWEFPVSPLARMILGLPSEYECAGRGEASVKGTGAYGKQVCYVLQIKAIMKIPEAPDLPAIEIELEGAGYFSKDGERMVGLDLRGPIKGSGKLEDAGGAPFTAEGQASIFYEAQATKETLEMLKGLKAKPRDSKMPGQ